MMACAAFRQFVTAYVDGELVGEDREAFESHLAACPACRRLLEEEQSVGRAAPVGAAAARGSRGPPRARRGAGRAIPPRPAFPPPCRVAAARRRWRAWRAFL